MEDQNNSQLDEQSKQLCQEISGLSSAHIFDTLPSTNDFALDRLKQSNLVMPALIWAREQTQGRGRGENRWESSSGSLTFSLAIEFSPGQNQSLPLSQISVGTAVIIARCLKRHCDVDCQIKWPNDIYLNGKKIAGILIESVLGNRVGIVIGCGINLNNVFLGDDRLSPHINYERTSIKMETGVDSNMNQFVKLLVAELLFFLQSLGTAPDQSVPQLLLEEFRDRDLLPGKMIEVFIGDSVARGPYRGVDSNGCLLVQVGYVTKTFVSGSVRIA